MMHVPLGKKLGISEIGAGLKADAYVEVRDLTTTKCTHIMHAFIN